MRLHAVSLPHTSTTKEFSWCAYTDKVRKWSTMMTSLGHEVYLYAGEQNEAQCTEHIDCAGYQFEERIPPFDMNHPGWLAFAFKAVKEISVRAQPNDYLCLIGGVAQKHIADAFPEMTVVEFGVGYEGIFSNFRVFESYAWMHTVYGQRMGAHGANGQFYDAVIPNFFEVKDFPLGQGDGDYLLYVGRLIERKGLQVVADVAKRTGKHLVIAGEGDTSLIPEDAQYMGLIGPAQRAKLMGEATTLICPTLYVEPFGGVAVEAQLCGTPVITTDFGAFSETVEQGKTGLRCHTLAEFCEATETVKSFNRTTIRNRARRLYSTTNVRHQYQEYFERLEGLRGEGWYA